MGEALGQLAAACAVNRLPLTCGGEIRQTDACTQGMSPTVPVTREELNQRRP